MKLKQTRKASTKPTANCLGYVGGKHSNPSTTSSEEEDVKMKTRRLSAQRKVSKNNTNSRKGSGLVESIYDADEDTATTSESSTEKMSVDLYEFDCIDIASTKSKSKNKSAQAKSQKEPRKKLQKGSNKKKTKATSTPILTSGKVSLKKSKINNNEFLVTPEVTPILSLDKTDLKKKSKSSKEFLATPEVTPILPVQPDCKKGPSDDSYNTPTVFRSLRKRSLHLEGKHLSAITSSFKSFGSQEDSGIVVSPPLKKIKSPDSFQSTPSHLEIDPIVSSREKRNPPSSVVNKKDAPDSGVALNFRHQRKRKILVHKTDNEVGKKGKTDTGLDTPTFSFSSDENSAPGRKSKPKKKVQKNSKQSYRSKKVSNSSSSLDSPLQGKPQVIDQENDRQLTSTPTFFSDDLFLDDNSNADDDFRVTKTSKSYTSLNRKSLKSEKLISKLDSWAKEFNSQFDDIEKFELFIE